MDKYMLILPQTKEIYLIHYQDFLKFPVVYQPLKCLEQLVFFVGRKSGPTEVLIKNSAI